MRRVTDFLVRNWPLKLGAIVFATILYSGLVLGQNVRTFNGTIPVEAIRQPADATMLSDLPPVTQVRYRAPIDVGVVSPDSFRATVDLSRVEAQPGGPAVPVPVSVIALDQRIQIVDYQPLEIEVRLDPVSTREMPVTVVVGTVPDGVSVGPPQVDPSSVTISGASSRVDIVTSVVARVAIDASALNVDREVDLVPVDSNGNQVPNVEMTPARARVRIAVARELATVSLPVVPQVTGQPAAGYRITSVTVDPVVITVSGEEGVVSQMQNAPTEPIDVAGRTTDLEAMVRFALPEGVSVTGNDSVRVVVTIAEETGTRSFAVAVVTDTPQLPTAQYTLGTNQVQVTLGGPISALNAVDAASLTAHVAVSALGAGTSTVDITFEPPSGLQLVDITPPQTTVTVVEHANSVISTDTQPMTKLFGTDGIRGVANVDLTPRMAYDLGRATAARLADGAGGHILIGQDTRRSGDMFVAAVGAGAMSMGADVHRLGVCPTPALAYLTAAGHFGAGVMVSASHNPARDNGLKVFDDSGIKLEDGIEDELEALMAARRRAGRARESHSRP